MLNNKLLMAAGAATLSASFFSGTLFAANVATGTANANVLQPIAILVGTDILDFGDIVPDAGATADVVLSPVTGNITSSGLATTSGTTAKGDFNVSGSNGASYIITVPDNVTVTLTDTGSQGGAPMTVKDFTTNLVGNQGALDATTGTQTISIGATLTVGANQIESTYSGTYDITVNYQ